MRNLVLTRGLPGSGKSTFLRNNNLMHYVISSDNIRLLLNSPELESDGRTQIPQRANRQAWDLLYVLVEERMKDGEFTIVDATHLDNKSLDRYLKLAKEWDYKVSLLDFSDVPLKTCLERNTQRDELLRIPDEVIIDKYTKLQKTTGKNLSGISVIKPEAFISWLEEKEFIDLSSYKKIHHIGDLQGCLTPLLSYLKDGIKDDEFYIFVGDYLDRGIENAEVIQFLLNNFITRKNVVFMEGNHELHLRYWVHNRTSVSYEFRERTLPVLEAANITREDVKPLVNRLQDFFIYKYQNKTVMVTHAGLPCIPNYPKLISSWQFTHGSGGYEQLEETGNTFLKKTSPDTYQVHGHRNLKKLPVQYNERCFVLEGKIEFGGELRCVDLDEKGWEPLELINTVVKIHKEKRMLPEVNIEEVLKAVDELRSNQYIRERSTNIPDVSSFNFTRKAFYKKVWNAQTVMARGLFINTKTGEIVARGYDKFWNIGEREDTLVENLKEKLSYPVIGYIKENGYLGLLGYDSASGQMLVGSKGSNTNEFSQWFQELLIAQYGDRVHELKQFMQNNNTNFLFEVILPNEDPHIISYNKPHLVLLDIVYRDLVFKRMPPKEAQSVAERFGFTYKNHAITLKTPEMFEGWLKAQNKRSPLEESVEGFVLQDQNGYQTKIKLPYYNFWKAMRSCINLLEGGKELPKVMHHDYPELQKSFLDFFALQRNENHDIISLRTAFLENLQKKDIEGFFL